MAPRVVSTAGVTRTRRQVQRWRRDVRLVASELGMVRERLADDRVALWSWSTKRGVRPGCRTRSNSSGKVELRAAYPIREACFGNSRGESSIRGVVLRSRNRPDQGRVGGRRWSGFMGGKGPNQLGR